MSRAERRARQAGPIAVTINIEEPEPMWTRETLSGFGVANVPGSQTKWFAYRCSTDGNVHLFTPLYDGKLRGESKPAATGRIRMALLKHLGGVE